MIPRDPPDTLDVVLRHVGTDVAGFEVRGPPNLGVPKRPPKRDGVNSQLLPSIGLEVGFWDPDGVKSKCAGDP